MAPRPHPDKQTSASAFPELEAAMRKIVATSKAAVDRSIAKDRKAKKDAKRRGD
jgi:hypothetical protein